jgi:hypothetical protein
MTDTAVFGADLDAVAAHLPGIACGLRARTLSPARLHTFGALLIELGENLHQHADSLTPPRPRCAPLEPFSVNNSGPV